MAPFGKWVDGRDRAGHERALVVVAHGFLPVADLARQLADWGDGGTHTDGGHRRRPRREHRVRADGQRQGQWPRAGRMGDRLRASTMQPASVIETKSTETQRRTDGIDT